MKKYEGKNAWWFIAIVWIEFIFKRKIQICMFH